MAFPGRSAELLAMSRLGGVRIPVFVLAFAAPTTRTR